MKWIIILLFISFQFEACTFGIRTKEAIQAVSKSNDRESFFIFIEEWKSSYADHINYPQQLIEIDSNNTRRKISKIYPIFDNTLIQIHNDSTLICEHIYPNHLLYFYNVKTHARSNELKENYFQEFSEDGKYFVTEDYEKWTNDFYKIKDDSIVMMGSIRDSVLLSSPLLGHKFIMAVRNNSEKFIINPDLTISDTIPKSFDGIYSFQSGKHKNGIVFASHTNEVIEYNFDLKKTDTLFSGMYFYDAISIPNSDYYLLQGMSQTEYQQEIEERNKGDESFTKQTGGCLLFGPIAGYWMIGNCKTKKISKVGDKDFQALISCTGRHILFYKYSNGDDTAKVVSLTKLVEGM